MRKHFLALCLGLTVVDAFGHEQIVHQAITVIAAASALSGSSTYAEFIELISADLSLKDATNAMVIGSATEDNVDTDQGAGRYRS